VAHCPANLIARQDADVANVHFFNIFSVGFSMTDLLKIQQCIFQMYRRILGDHSFKTGNTHLNVLKQHGLHHPLELLFHAGCKLRRTLGQRLTLVQSDDIVNTVDWTHLQHLLQLVHVTWQEQSQVHMSIPDDEALAQPFHCEFCPFRSSYP